MLLLFLGSFPPLLYPRLLPCRRMAVDPEELPDTVFASIGRMVWRDVGFTAIGFRLLMKVSRKDGTRRKARSFLPHDVFQRPPRPQTPICRLHASMLTADGKPSLSHNRMPALQLVDYNLMAYATALTGHLLPDFKRHAKKKA
jgi:hypothetical protein